MFNKIRQTHLNVVVIIHYTRHNHRVSRRYQKPHTSLSGMPNMPTIPHHRADFSPIFVSITLLTSLFSFDCLKNHADCAWSLTDVEISSSTSVLAGSSGYSAIDILRRMAALMSCAALDAIQKSLLNGSLPSMNSSLKTLSLFVDLFRNCMYDLRSRMTSLARQSLSWSLSAHNCDEWYGWVT